MNFLAHLYLSNNNKDVIIGNYIADHMKGKKLQEYPEEIQKGVQLHRAIDSFTDSHQIVRKSKRRLHERYGHYDGVIIDILYDHFLAKNWSNYSAIPLEVYSASIYKLLKDNEEVLPSQSVRFLEYMIQYDILYNYKLIEGIQKVLNGMNYRTKGKSQMNLAVEDLKLHYDALESDFTLFFEDLRNYCQEKLQNL